MKKKHALYILAAGGFLQLGVIFTQPSGYLNTNFQNLNPFSGVVSDKKSPKNDSHNERPKLSQTAQNKSKPKKLEVFRNMDKECVVWGPLFGASYNKSQKLIVTYNENFKNKLKTYEKQIPIWNIIVAGQDTSSPSETMEAFQKLNIDLDNVIFLENGDILVNSFNEKTDALNFSYFLDENNQKNYLIQDERSEYYYYMINPTKKYYARLQAFDTYFDNTSIIEIDCNKDNTTVKNE